VTPEGLAHIQEMVDLAQEQHTAARDAGDANEVARTERDLRYWDGEAGNGPGAPAQLT